MKLELKHLAPYLPYGLRISTDLGNRTMRSCRNNTTKENYVVIDDDEEQMSWRPIKDGSKPILRPLPDSEGQTKKAKRLIIMVSEDSEYSTDAVKMTLRRSRTAMVVGVYEALLKNHFDVFGLIPEGLAIDINTL